MVGVNPDDARFPSMLRLKVNRENLKLRRNKQKLERLTKTGNTASSISWKSTESGDVGFEVRAVWKMLMASVSETLNIPE